MTAPLRLRLATSNPGKGQELARLIGAALGPDVGRLRLCDLADLRGFRAAEEDGATYGENAARKAAAAAAADPAAAVLADDSGLEVDALHGAPGLRSARWATTGRGEPLDGAGLNAALLARLGGLPAARRGARLVAALALILPGQGVPALGHGDVTGRVALQAAGRGGFGYDHVFLLPDGRRLADLPGPDKDAVSHRGQALAAMAGTLQAWVAAAAAPTSPRTSR